MSRAKNKKNKQSAVDAIASHRMQRARALALEF